MTVSLRAALYLRVSTARQSDRAFAVTSDTWDRDTFMLGTPGGTVDLRTAKLRPATQTDFITRLTAVAPAESPECPLWLDFLEEATGADAGLIRFLRQWCGYALTGDIREHALLFIHGQSGNGKGVFLGTLNGILGDYCTMAAMDTFTASAGDRHPTDLARLKGARLVTASETEEGRPWAEVRINQLTGGDKIAARLMRQDFFEFTPQFKLTVIGNHKPALRNINNAARRRFNIVPFTHRPLKPDKVLPEKLKDEWPGILRWMIEGCIDWQRNGLVRPPVVMQATEDYFQEQDIFRQWIGDCCEESPRVADTCASLRASWPNYAVQQGEEPGTSKSFGAALRKADYQPIKDEDGVRGRGFRGLKVNTYFDPS